MVKVLVNGVGVIGKRVAHAVKLQDDMELVGISDAFPTPTVRTLLSEKGPLYGTPLYASSQEFVKNFDGMYIEGTLEDLLKNGGVDVVIDASPAGIDRKNKENLYSKYGVKAIFQGGAKADIADVSFNSFTNYDAANGKQFVRVVSCNTTSLARTLFAVSLKAPIKSVFASLVRRAVDPVNTKKGPLNAIEPVLEVPSHHGPDLQTVFPVNIQTMAVKAPTTLMHVHMVRAELGKDVARDEIIESFASTPRIRLYDGSLGYATTAQIIETARDELRPRYDHPWVAIWKDTIKFEDGILYWMHAVHSESIVIPENIDAIRSMFGMLPRDESIRKTDANMGL